MQTVRQCGSDNLLKYRKLCVVIAPAVILTTGKISQTRSHVWCRFTLCTCPIQSHSVISDPVFDISSRHGPRGTNSNVAGLKKPELLTGSTGRNGKGSGVGSYDGTGWDGPAVSRVGTGWDLVLKSSSGWDGTGRDGTSRGNVMGIICFPVKFSRGEKFRDIITGKKSRDATVQRIFYHLLISHV